MGASAQINTTVNNIQTNISQTLQQQVSASSSANCNVTIGSLSFKKTTGCMVTVSNMCSASSTGVLQASLEGIFKSYDELSTANQQAMPSLMTASLGINTTTNNIKQDFSTYVDQTCGANSTLNQNITIQNIDLGECTAPSGQVVEFKFINSGAADANCAIGAVMKLAVQATNSVTTSNTTQSSMVYLIIGACILIGVIAFFICAYYLSKTFRRPTFEQVQIEWAKKGINSFPLDLLMIMQSTS